MTSNQPKPLLIGLKAARANLIPGVIIQGVMLAIVLAYYWHEPTRVLLNTLAAWKDRLGYGFSVPLAIVAGAVLPELFKRFALQQGKMSGRSRGDFLFTVVFWGFMGASVDTFYRFQTIWFGGATTFFVLAKKVFVDQFIYNPFWAAPLQVWAYEWKNRSYALAEISDFFTVEFYRTQIVPVLIATWGVWLVMITIIYSLPPLLQIPLFGLALTFWVLIMTYISSRKSVRV